jgi:hypothetical protein
VWSQAQVSFTLVEADELGDVGRRDLPMAGHAAQYR